MQDALVTGAAVVLAAAMSAWLIEGGIARRSRRAIREELELVDLLGKDSQAGRAILDRVRQRAARYARLSIRDRNFEQLVREHDREISWFEVGGMTIFAGLLAWLGVGLFLDAIALERDGLGEWARLLGGSLASGLLLAMAGVLARGALLLRSEKFSKRVTVDPTSAPRAQDQPTT